MRLNRLAILLLAAAPASLLAQSAIQPATLTIDTANPKARVSPTLYGFMTEEINYSYDGGIYGELISNRTFSASWSGVDHWTLIQNGDARATIASDNTTGPSAALTRRLKL